MLEADNRNAWMRDCCRQCVRIYKVDFDIRLKGACAFEKEIKKGFLMNKELGQIVQHIGQHLPNGKNVQQAVLGGAAAAGTAVVGGVTTVGGVAATGVSVATSAVAAVVAAPLAITAAAAVGVGYGVKKLADWLSD